MHKQHKSGKYLLKKWKQYKSGIEHNFAMTLSFTLGHNNFDQGSIINLIPMVLFPDVSEIMDVSQINYKGKYRKGRSWN